VQSKTLKYHLPDGQTAKLFSLLEEYINKNEELGIIIKKEIKLLISQIQEVQFSNDDMASHFPVEIDIRTKVKHYTHEFSWSCGDLPILILLYKTDEVFGENYYKFMANTVGKVLSTRIQLLPINQNPYLRNGTAGIAQSFYMLYNLSGKEFYQDAYHYWISETQRLINLEKKPILSSNILDNLEGVNLVLASYRKENTMEWIKRILW
jgi:hypothetical protein